MTTFWRAGHWRSGTYGQHWVAGHWVNRDGWASSWDYSVVTPSTHSSAGQRERWIDPNALCPVCGAEVFFYSNEYGSRVYFDDLGPPWPKHPCTDTSTGSVRSQSEPGLASATSPSRIRASIQYDSAPDHAHIPGVFVVSEVEKRGPKRVVTLQEIGGECIEVLVSPPAPPIHAIAVAEGFELHWFDPRSETRGKNLIWRRT